jgi:hypothetical protein
MIFHIRTLTKKLVTLEFENGVTRVLEILEEINDKENSKYTKILDSNGIPFDDNCILTYYIFGDKVFNVIL